VLAGKFLHRSIEAAGDGRLFAREKLGGAHCRMSWKKAVSVGRLKVIPSF
jgi:hypothetical protein